MIPDDDAIFLARLVTNEMVERERFTTFLAAIESELRLREFAGPNAILLIGALNHGSLEVVLGVVGAAGGALSAIFAIPNFLIGLKKLAADDEDEPNPFALTLGEIMALDGAARLDLVYKGKVMSIHRDDVPYFRRIAPRKSPSSNTQTATSEPIEYESKAEEDIGIEDEDRDWVPMLEARDHSPREARERPTGELNSLAMVGEFTRPKTRNGEGQLRFLPRESILAPYFVVISHAYDDEPQEAVQYDVVGNISLSADGPATIEILSISPPEPMLPLRN